MAKSTLPNLVVRTVMVVVASLAVTRATSTHTAYLQYTQQALAEGRNPDSCCFSHPSLASASPLQLASRHSRCAPPFGFCHRHTVGHSFDKPSNFQVPADSSPVRFYRCGDYGETCNDVCTNTAYDAITVNSGQARAGNDCLEFEFDDETMVQYAFTMRRWELTGETGAPL